MIRALVLVLLAFPALAADVPTITPFDSKIETKTCADCPPDRPCTYRMVKFSNDCNTCTAVAYCSEGKWYTTGFVQCTLLACNYRFEIANPFKEEKPK